MNGYKTAEKEKVLKIKGNKTFEIMDTMIEEHPVTLFFNDTQMMSIMCSPSALKELAVGFFYLKGMIQSYEEIKEILIDYRSWGTTINVKTKDTKTKYKAANFFDLSEENISFESKGSHDSKESVNLEQGFQKLLTHYELTQEELLKMMDAFSHKSKLFVETGGVHSIGIYKKGEAFLFYDDVSRYNTYNKLFGGILMHKVPLEDKLLLTTGRIPREVMSWIINEGIKCVLSISVPTRGSVLLARQNKVGLMGFVRGDRLNLYSTMF